MTSPLLLTMGDAAGIGPEIVLRAFLQGQAAGPWWWAIRQCCSALPGCCSRRGCRWR